MIEANGATFLPDGSPPVSEVWMSILRAAFGNSVISLRPELKALYSGL